MRGHILASPNREPSPADFAKLEPSQGEPRCSTTTMETCARVAPTCGGQKCRGDGNAGRILPTSSRNRRLAPTTCSPDRLIDRITRALYAPIGQLHFHRLPAAEMVDHRFEGHSDRA